MVTGQGDGCGGSPALLVLQTWVRSLQTTSVLVRERQVVVRARSWPALILCGTSWATWAGSPLEEPAHFPLTTAP